MKYKIIKTIILTIIMGFILFHCKSVYDKQNAGTGDKIESIKYSAALSKDTDIIILKEEGRIIDKDGVKYLKYTEDYKHMNSEIVFFEMQTYKKDKRQITSVPYWAGIEHTSWPLSYNPFIRRNLLENHDKNLWILIGALSCYMRIYIDYKKNLIIEPSLSPDLDIFHVYNADIDSNGTEILFHTGSVINTKNNLLKYESRYRKYFRDKTGGEVFGAKYLNDNEPILVGANDGLPYMKQILMLYSENKDRIKIISSGETEYNSLNRWYNPTPLSVSPNKKKAAFPALYRDYESLITRLRSSNKNSAEQRVWNLLSESCKLIIKQWTPETRYSENEILDGLNEILQRRDFYDEKAFSHIEPIEKDIKDQLIDKGIENLNSKQLILLNRILLESIFPQTFEKIRPLWLSIWDLETNKTERIYLLCSDFLHSMRPRPENIFEFNPISDSNLIAVTHLDLSEAERGWLFYPRMNNIKIIDVKQKKLIKDFPGINPKSMRWSPDGKKLGFLINGEYSTYLERNKKSDFSKDLKYTEIIKPPSLWIYDLEKDTLEMIDEDHGYFDFFWINHRPDSKTEFIKIEEAKYYIVTSVFIIILITILVIKKRKKYRRD